MPQINVSCKASMHIGKKWSAAHNRRTYDKEKWNLDGHIQADRSDLNVTLCDTDYKTWFHQAFDAAIDEYNAKNAVKHSERLIGKDKYCAEQSGKVQECIIQLGDHQTYMEMVDKIGVAAADQLHIQFLTDAFKQWQQENPSFRVFSAIIHMDETKDGTPHLHLDFMPVAQSKRGLAVKVSVDGALKEIGFDRKKDQKYAEAPYRRWLGVQRERIETLAAQYVDLIPSEHDTGRQHIETWQYRSEQAREACAEREAEQQRVSAVVKELQEEQERLTAELQPLIEAKASAEEVQVAAKGTLFGGKVTLKKEDFDKIQEQAAAYRVHQAELQDFVAYRAEFEAYKEDTQRIINESEAQIQDSAREASERAYREVKEQMETYEKQAKSCLDTAKKEAGAMRLAAAQQLEKSGREQAETERVLRLAEKQRKDLADETYRARKAAKEAEEAYQRNIEACRLRDEAEKKASQLQEEVAIREKKIDFIECAFEREIHALDEAMRLMQREHQTELHSEIERNKAARRKENAENEQRTRERIEGLQATLAAKNDTILELESELKTQREQQDAQRRREIAQTEEKYKLAMDGTKKELTAVKGELELVKKKLKDALVFAMESCQALGTMLNYRNQDYYANNLTFRQESLLEAVRELGAKLVKSCGYDKIADEMEQKDGLTERLEKRIDDKTYSKSYDRGGMCL